MFSYHVFIHTLLAFCAAAKRKAKAKSRTNGMEMECGGERGGMWNTSVYIIAYIYRVHLTMKRIN